MASSYDPTENNETIFDCCCSDCDHEWESEPNESGNGPEVNECPECGCARFDSFERDADQY